MISFAKDIADYDFGLKICSKISKLIPVEINDFSFNIHNGRNTRNPNMRK